MAKGMFPAANDRPAGSRQTPVGKQVSAALACVKQISNMAYKVFFIVQHTNTRSCCRRSISEPLKLKGIFGCFQLLYISKVLQARGGFLIRNQVLTRNYKRGHTSKQGLQTIGPRFRKLNASMSVIRSIRNGGTSI